MGNDQFGRNRHDNHLRNAQPIHAIAPALEQCDVLITCANNEDDISLATSINDELEKANISVHTAVNRSREAAKIAGKMLVEAKVLISVVSKASSTCGHCQDQVSLAYISNKPIIVVARESKAKLMRELSVGMKLTLDSLRWFLFEKEEEKSKILMQFVQFVQEQLSPKELTPENPAPEFSRIRRINTKLQNKTVGQNTNTFWDCNFADLSVVPWSKFQAAFLGEYEAQLIGLVGDENIPWLLDSLREAFCDEAEQITRGQFMAIRGDSHDENAFWRVISQLTVEKFNMREVFNMNSTVRLKAIEELSTFQNPAVIDALLRLLEDTDPNVRAVAATSLSKTGNSSEEVVDSLIGLLRDGEHVVRWSACLGLGRLKAVKAIPAIGNIWRDDYVSVVRDAARTALEDMGTPEANKVLQTIDPEKQKYIQKLNELVEDTRNTILLYYFKMYFIGSSGLGKSTTRKRLTGSITNISSLPEELRKRCSTFLAECSQVLAMMDVDKSKLTLKVSASPEEEMQALFAYVYSSLPLPLDPTPPPEIADRSDRLPANRPEPTPPTPSTSEPRAVTTKATPSTPSIDEPRAVRTKTTPQQKVKKSKQVTVPTVNVAQVIARFRSIVGSGDYTEQLMGKILLNLIDMGGQPGFLEMLPFLSKGPGMFFAFFRLDKDLDELCEVSYEREGDKITPYPAIYTIRETLSQILSAISHHVTQDTVKDRELLSKLGDLASVKPVATLVGTFKDKLETKVKIEALQKKLSVEFPQASESEKEEVVKQVLASQSSGDQPTTALVNNDMVLTANQILASDSFAKEVAAKLNQELENKNKAISSISSNFEDLLVHPTDSQHFVALDNFAGKEEDIDPLREHVQKIFNSFFKDAQLRIRPTQLLLGVILRKEYDIVSMDDCIHIGRALNMTEEEVRFSVWYLDRFVGALIYHPEIEDEDGWFKKNIICSPQVVFDSISSLIVEPLLELHSPEGLSRDVKFTTAEKRNWREKGQFSLDTVNRCLSDENQAMLKQGRLIPTNKLVVLLEHSHLLSRVIVKKQGRTRKESEEMRFFIPAILECASPKELTKAQPPDTDTPSPIKITFKTGYVPTGVFCALISTLVTRGGEGILGIKWELVEYGIKRNLVTFHIDDVDHLITLVARVDCYEIQVIRQDRSISLHDLCSYILSAVLYVMKEVNENIDPIIAFDCKCGKQQSLNRSHLCQLSSGMTTSFKCTRRQVSLTADQEHWFAKEVTLDNDVILDALPYTEPNPTLSFKWMKSGKKVLSCKNELRVEKVTQEHCKGFYTCVVSKDYKPFFSVYYCLKATSTTLVSDDSDQLFDDLRQATKEVRSDWYSLAIELGIDHGTRKAIESDYRFVDVCFHAVLRHWVRTTSPPLTWTGLVRALRSPVIDRGDVAEEVESMMEPGDATSDDDASSKLCDPLGPLSVDKHLKVVREATWEARSNWYDLGVELGVHVGTLKAIKRDREESDLCYTSLLEKWLIQTDPPPEWSDLVTALKLPSIGCAGIAREVEAMICNSCSDTAAGLDS